MKKRKILFSAVLLLCCMVFCFSAFAADIGADVVVSLQINNPLMEVNGVSAEIDEGRGTTPVITNGRTLVPIRAIVEAFGGKVEWEESSKSVILTMNDNTVRLIIDSTVAYLNNDVYYLDVAPTVINSRTMLPIRFVAESFNLGVAWDGKNSEVSIIRDTFNEEEYKYLMSILPSYSGKPFVEINGNEPFFNDYEIINGSFEYYSNLDELGRCDVCMASVAKDIMPSGERESISSVTPTGWINASYDFIPGGYLYNRCHLIGWQLTGENANKRNLITGTRYLNIEGMLPFENKVDDYIDETGERVTYRVTPVFGGNNLVAEGVLIEAFSNFDEGEGVSFCVYCYNVQPGIKINYLNGASSPENQSPENVTFKVYRTPSGKKYHFDKECGGKNSYEVTLDEAEAAGLTPCAKCAE